MKKNLEIEYKTLCSREQYLTVRNNLHNPDRIVQKNTYFDNRQRTLLSRKMMLRIRQWDNNMEATLKIPVGTAVQELNFFCSSLSIEQPELLEFLENIGISGPFESIGYSETERLMVTDEYAELCLDHTRFSSGHEDYEIEYELLAENNEAFTNFQNILQSYGIPYKKAPSKVMRMLAFSEMKERV